ncbi:MAG: DedA family protein [Actinomycetota bacterium]|nr:DedA family protein [Actinomycetota bacterium]
MQLSVPHAREGLESASSTVVTALRARRRGRLIVAIVIATAAFAATSAGVIPMPDLEAGLADLSERLGTWTYVLVAILAFLETGAFIGLLAPGETAVLLGGVVAAHGEVDLALIILLTWVAAAGGDLVSFLLGRRLGRRFVVVRGPRLGLTPDRLERVEGFFDRHGPKAILAGRFVGIVRAVAPFLAGASRMRPRAFVPWSLLGTALWATVFVLVGYAFSQSFGLAADILTHGALGLAVVVLAIVLWRAHRPARA